jgi:hypothetical protein
LRGNYRNAMVGINSGIDTVAVGELFNRMHEAV